MDTTEAHMRLLLAERMVAEARHPPGRSEAAVQMDLASADEIRANALDALSLGAPPQVVTGNELIAVGSGRSPEPLRPGKVAVKASVERMNSIHCAGVVDLALDAAESVGATTAIEKMLVHQLAAAHKNVMEQFEKGNNVCDPIIETKRMNAAARLMTVFQHGALALQRLQTGGGQTITVRQVVVADGGQAVIGTVAAGGGGGDRGGTK